VTAASVPGKSPSWRAASGIPSRTLRQPGAQPVAVFKVTLLIRCEREISSAVLPPSVLSQRGRSFGVGVPIARAQISPNAWRVTGSSSATV
jgi:hypothetical protein